MVARIGRAEHRLLERAGAVAGRNGHNVEGVVGPPSSDNTCDAAPCSPLRVEAMKICTGAAVVAATAGPPKGRRNRPRSPQGRARRRRQAKKNEANRRATQPSHRCQTFPLEVAAAPLADATLARYFRHPCGESETQGGPRALGVNARFEGEGDQRGDREQQAETRWPGAAAVRVGPGAERRAERAERERKPRCRGR